MRSRTAHRVSRAFPAGILASAYPAEQNRNPTRASFLTREAGSTGFFENMLFACNVFRVLEPLVLAALTP